MDLRDGKRQTLLGHVGAVRGIAVTRLGRAVSVSDDGNVIVWNLKRSAVVARFGTGEHLSSCAISGDGKVVAATGALLVASIGSD